MSIENLLQEFAATYLDPNRNHEVEVINFQTLSKKQVRINIFVALITLIEQFNTAKFGVNIMYIHVVVAVIETLKN